jgi:hypothetical protein
MRKLLPIASLFTFALMARADLVNLSGAASLNLAQINFACAQMGDPVCNPSNGGDFSTGMGTGLFAPAADNFGQIQNLSLAPGPVMSLLTFNAAPGVTVTINTILPGTDTASATCAGVMNCTPTVASLVSPTNPLGLTALNLNQGAEGTAVSFSYLGIVMTPQGSSPITGLVTAGLAGDSSAQAVAALDASLIDYSTQISAAPIVSNVAEAKTVFLSGAGLMALWWLARRRQRTA